MKGRRLDADTTHAKELLAWLANPPSRKFVVLGKWLCYNCSKLVVRYVSVRKEVNYLKEKGSFHEEDCQVENKHELARAVVEKESRKILPDLVSTLFMESPNYPGAGIVYGHFIDWRGNADTIILGAVSADGRAFSAFSELSESKVEK